MNENSIKESIIEIFKDKEVDEDIVNYIVENYNLIIYMSFERFCYEINCSNDKMENFLKYVGFNDFEQFKGTIQNIKCERYSDKADEHICRDKVLETVNELVNIELNNIFDFKNNIDVNLVTRLIDDILSSEDVVLVGTRASTPLVTYAAYIFNKIGIRTTKIDSADTSYFDIIPNLDRTTLIIAFGFSRYPKGTIRLLNFLKKRGFKIVSVTDYIKSPLINFSEYSLIVKANSYDYTDSYIGAMLLINTLIISMGKIDNKRLLKRLKEYDETAQNLGYFL